MNKTIVYVGAGIVSFIILRALLKRWVQNSMRSFEFNKLCNNILNDDKYKVKGQHDR